MTGAVRAGRDADGPAMAALIEACWSEYPGCVMDLDGENPHLRAPATHYAGQGGALLVAEADGRLVGTVSSVVAGKGVLELKGLYVDRAWRGTGLAQALLAGVEAFARRRGDRRLVLWSDTRFGRAHRFYERAGYVPAGAIRALGDRSNSLEYPYAKPLASVAVERLDGAAATAAARALAAILADVVASGASVSFLHPLAADRAEAFCRERARAVATEGLLLYAGWCAGRLAGTVSVRPAAQENAGHRAEIAKLVVHPECRRRGLGEALLAAAIAGAREAGRTLLTLDTRPGDAAERMVRRHGFREVGRIEGYTRTADGRSEPTVLFALETTVTPRPD